jgi:hypothetical protein
VSAEVAWENGKTQIYIQPHPVIRRMTLSETMDTLGNIRANSTMSSEFYVEAVAYQQAAIEEMDRRAFSVHARSAIAHRAVANEIDIGVVLVSRPMPLEIVEERRPVRFEAMHLEIAQRE